MALTDFRAVYLPYCLSLVGESTYVVLNREYLPLGFNSRSEGGMIDKSTLPIATVIKGLTASKIKKISVHPEYQPGTIYLYDDSTNPYHGGVHFENYVKKLKILSTLETSPGEFKKKIIKLPPNP